MTDDCATQPLHVLDEERARGELYGLLARIFYAQPDAQLLAKLRLAPTVAASPGGFLEQPWCALVGLAHELTDDQIDAEFEALFAGVGKPEVYLYGSYYQSGFLNEKPLARLRTELTRLGLARTPTMSDTEDHIAYLFEVMRYLIASQDVALANLAQQQAFFTAHLQTWVVALCDALEQHPKARFYATVATLTRAFMSVEVQGFDMLS